MQRLSMLQDIDKFIELKKDNIKKKLECIDEDIKPKLHIFYDTRCENEATKSYLKSKVNMGKELGIEVILRPVQSFVSVLHYVNDVHHQDGTILQLPANNDVQKAYRELYRKNDVDGFFNLESIYNNIENEILPATPKGIMEYLEYFLKEKGNGRKLNKMNVLIMGRGKLVGKPLVSMMLNKCATLQIATSKTKSMDLKVMYRNADIIILATGDKNSLSMIPKTYSLGKAAKTKPKSCSKKIIIDTGIFKNEDGSLRGEFNIFEWGCIPALNESVIFYTPVPKGVGRLTVISLFDNVVVNAEQKGLWED